MILLRERLFHPIGFEAGSGTSHADPNGMTVTVERGACFVSSDTSPCSGSRLSGLQAWAGHLAGMMLRGKVLLRVTIALCSMPASD
jgi:hypothetical protein